MAPEPRGPRGGRARASRSRDILALAALLAVQATFSSSLLASGGAPWPQDGCRALRVARSLLARGPRGLPAAAMESDPASLLALATTITVLGAGARATAASALVMGAALLVLGAGLVRRLASPRAALLAGALLATTPPAIRAPLLAAGDGPLSSAVLAAAFLHLAIGGGAPGALAAGAVAGLALVHHGWFVALLLAVAVLQRAGGVARWWLPLLTAGAMAVALPLAAGGVGAIPRIAPSDDGSRPIRSPEGTGAALAWALLAPAAAIVVDRRDRSGRWSRALLLCIAVAGGFGLVLADGVADPLPVCGEALDGGPAWREPGEDGLFSCDGTKEPWEACVRRAGRDAAWATEPLEVPASATDPAAHFFALGVGEGLADLLGPGGEPEAARRCAALGGWHAGSCAAGIGVRGPSRCASLAPALRARCAQGVGAGILAVAWGGDRSIEASFDRCAAVPPDLRPHCVRGLAQAYGLANRGLEDPEPADWRHCEGVPERYFVQCMGGLAANFGWEGELSAEAAVRSCASPVREETSKFCLINFGAAAGLRFHGEPARAFALCEALPPDLAGYCIEGAGDGIAWSLVTEP